MDDGVLEITLKHLKDQVDRIASVILGDPSDPSKPGHEIRIDRMEQKQKTLSRIVWGIGTICITVAISLVVNFFMI